MPFDGLVQKEVIESPQESTIVNEETRTLIEMKQLLLEKGWCQHVDRDFKGQLCVTGAFHMVRNNRYMLPLQIFKIANKIQSDITSWNDTPGLKLKDVLQALDKAIEYSKEHTS